MKTITLSKFNVFAGATAGITKSVCSMFREDRAGCDSAKDGFQINCMGAIAELAFAQFMDLFYDGTPNTFKSRPDVGDFEIRSTHYQNGKLILRDGDKFDDTIYVLALTGDLPNVHFPGWIRGSDAKNTEFIERFGNSRDECWAVPQDKLQSIESLKS